MLSTYCYKIASRQTMYGPRQLRQSFASTSLLAAIFFIVAFQVAKTQSTFFLEIPPFRYSTPRQFPPPKWELVPSKKGLVTSKKGLVTSNL